jgi:carbon monoxide dehydrogenase subunit G
MDFKGQYRIPATPDAVWVALHNPEVLAAAIPGCEKVEKLSETEFKAKAVIKIGPVKAAFEGRVTLVPAPAPEGFTHAVMLKGEGQGGPAGFARGESQVRLARDGDGTVLDYDAKAAVGGRLAQIGQRLIDGTAKSLADAFFAKFAALLESKAAPAAEAKTPAPPAPDEAGLAPQIWVAGLIAIVIVMLILFGIVL